MANSTGTVYQNGNNIQSGVVQIIVDDEEAVQTLDTSYFPGSTCIVSKTFNVYVLGEDHVWRMPE